MSHVLNSLGWSHAQIGSKAVDFAAEFNALGVKVDLKLLPQGLFTLANKQGRVEKVIELLQKVIQEGTISRKGAAELQGLLNFALGFYLSKSLRFLLGAFERMSEKSNARNSKDLRTLCQTVMTLLRDLPARIFDARKLGSRHLLFTDGSWEQGAAKAGAVFFNGCSGLGWIAEIDVPQRLIDIWNRDVGEQLICQIEYYAFLVLRYFVASEIMDQQAIAWGDNEPARATAIRGSSTSLSLMGMARVTQLVEVRKPSLVWIERGSSFSNPADDPSRDRATASSRALGLPKVDRSLTLPESVVEIIVELMDNPLEGDPTANGIEKYKGRTKSPKRGRSTVLQELRLF